MATTSAPIETKVTAATAGSIISAFIVYLLGEFVFKGSDVPTVVIALVQLLIVGVVTFASGYLAKHTPRIVDQNDKI